MRKKIAYIVGKRYDAYRGGMFKALGDRYDAQKFNHYEEIRKPDDYDCIFIEWLDAEAIKASQQEHKNLIVRLTGVEVYLGRVQRINWENVNWLLALQSHQIDYFKRRWLPHITGPRNYGVLPLLAFPEEFPLRERDENKNVALVAHITCRKGTDQIPEFLNRHKELEIYHLGQCEAYGPPVKEFVRWRLERDGNKGRYHYQNRRPAERMGDWYQDKTYLWLPSIQEGFSRAILEGMLCGLKPIIRHWAGAETIWPSKFLYDDMNDIQRILKLPYKPAEYKEYVTKKFSIEEVMKKLEEFL